MAEFWEENFKSKQEMWGKEPALSAVLTQRFFEEKALKKILIPGIGYGRNAGVFLDSGMVVTGIEISETAIDLALKNWGNRLPIFHGSVTDMPFDTSFYDGIFCYGLIHLLSENERKKLIKDCYNQLRDDGYMVFTAVTKSASIYGKGTEIGKDRFEMFGGVHMFFYDKESIENEFGNYGLIEVSEVIENFPFYVIKCKKA